MKQPSFFIVGAPKAGTTALCRYLERHPDIFISPIKEPNYFNKDINKNKTSPAKTISEYLALFAAGEGKVCGEGSTSYLRSEVAAREIYQFNPEAKIIIMLREPVSLLYSFHSQLLWNGSSEEIEDFQEAIAAESDRRQGQRIPQKCKNPEVLFYRNIVRFSEQIERYFSYFGRERVKIIIFDEFSQETQKSYREILDFIGVDPNFTTEFVKINSNKKARSRFVQNLYKYPPAKVLEIGKFFLPLPQSMRRALLEKAKSFLQSLNMQKVKRKALGSEFKKSLSREFYEEIDRLSKLLDKDLSHWKIG